MEAECESAHLLLHTETWGGVLLLLLGGGLWRLSARCGSSLIPAAGGLTGNHRNATPPVNSSARLHWPPRFYGASFLITLKSTVAAGSQSEARGRSGGPAGTFTAGLLQFY